MRTLLAAAVMLLAASSARAGDTAKVEMTRGDAAAAFSAIAAIGQYQTIAKQAGQDVVVLKFLDVSAAMRSTLTHDETVLSAAYNEMGKLQNDAKQRLGDGTAAYTAELATIAQQKVTLELVLFAESDLQLDKNPQITPLYGAALSVLEAPPKSGS